MYSQRMETIQIDRVAVQEAIAEEVRAELARKRLSGVRAAKALGWTQNYIARRMIGAVPFDAVDLVALAELLGIPAARFFDLPSDIRTPG